VPVPVRPSILRPALLAAALLGLLTIVALASRSDRPARPSAAEDRSLPLEFWDYLLTFGLLLIVGLLAASIFLKVPVVGRRGGGFGFTQLFGIMLICALVAYGGTRYEWPTVTEDEGIEEQVVGEGTETTPQPQAEQAQPESSRALRFRWEVFVAAGGLVALGLGAYLARRRFGPMKELAGRVDAADALSAALDESVDDLRAERDSRRAVIAAYARMERVLGRHGFPRFRSEAPLEYLARVLRELRVRSGAVLALTELFERAKFSPHTIDPEMKEEAIGALVAVRDDLKAVAR
jgi:Domain of unknown function (DUF4129)